MKNGIVLIQGALDVEIQYLVSLLKNKKQTEINGYEFYEGELDNVRVVISETQVGVINVTIATCLGITNFNPSVVINQGIAGAQTEDLHIGDIVIGEKCCNINSYKMPSKAEGEGSNPSEWVPNKRAKDIKYADSYLVTLFQKGIAQDARKVYTGTLGSGDVRNREYDRIIWLNKTFDNLCEDMESIGVYSVCYRFNVPCIGVRIISNNDLISEKFDEDQAVELQKILVGLLSEISKTVAK